MRPFAFQLLVMLSVFIVLNTLSYSAKKHYVNSVNHDLKVEFGWPVAFCSFWIESRVPPVFSLSPVEPEHRPRLTPLEFVLWEFGNDEYVDTINYGLAISLGKMLVVAVWWGTTYWCLVSCFQAGGFRFGLRQVILVQALAATAFFLMMFT